MSKRLLTKEEVLQRIDSYDIFCKYLGTEIQLGRTINSPLRDEKNPSFNLYKANNGHIYFKDFGGDSGSCFDFVCLLYNLSFVEAVNKIIYDFNLGESTLNRDIERIKPLKVRRIVPDKPKSLFIPNIKEFSSKELEWWGSFGIGLNTLNRYKVSSLENLTLKRDKQDDFVLTSTVNNPLYAYTYPSRRYKFYRPLVKDKKYKFLSNTNKTDIFGLEQIERLYEQVCTNKGDYDKLYAIVICAGQKDAMSMYANTPINTICLSSESSVLYNDLYNRLNEIAEYVIVCYDNDKTGKECADKMHNDYGLLVLDISKFTKEKDIADYISKEGNPDNIFNEVGKLIERQKKFVL